MLRISESKIHPNGKLQLLEYKYDTDPHKFTIKNLFIAAQHRPGIGMLSGIFKSDDLTGNAEFLLPMRTP